MEMEPIEYRGELVALAGAERFYIVAPWLLERPAGDPVVRFVAFMCVCRREAALSGMDGPIDGETLATWVRRALIDERELVDHSELSDLELGRRMNVPPEQIAAARSDLCADGPSR
jgi:hypothetical protein